MLLLMDASRAWDNQGMFTTTELIAIAVAYGRASVILLAACLVSRQADRARDELFDALRRESGNRQR
jgi:hypothetical protein